MKRYFFTFLFLFTFDRLSKVYFIKKAAFGSTGGFFDLHINQNIAFSLPVPSVIIYPLFSIIFIFLLFAWHEAHIKKSILIWAWGLMIVGAISNVLDRLQYGGVVDFINVPYFTVLNISDIYISLGLIWIVWYQLKVDKQTKVQ